MNKKPARFHVKAATEGDWLWMMQGQMEIIWEQSHHQTRVSQQMIQERLNQQVAIIRGPEGFPNQAFVAQEEHGHPAGFVWVGEIRGEFTGQPEAFVLAVYVAKPNRGQGLGRRLMEVAEEWARERGLQRIVLSVAALNAPARGLYEATGYQVETVRMGKSLDGPA